MSLWAWLVLAGAAALLLTTLIALLVVRAYRGPVGVTEPEAAGPRPVILVHGLIGFDSLTLLGRTHIYFRGVADALEQRGVEVHTPKLPPLDGVPTRAAALADYLEAIDARQAVLIGHSMGGLDARYAVAKTAARDRVAAVVSIGTPHQGTVIAGVVDRLPGRWLLRVLGRLGARSEALAWLSEESLDRFNREVENVDGVYYGSVVGVASRMQVVGFPNMSASFELLRMTRGPNDGLVPQSSQKWGEVMAEISADHFAQIGWRRYFDAPALYVQILSQLGARGLGPLATSSSADYASG